MNKKRMAVGLLLFLILLIGLIVWNQKNRVENTAIRQSQERQKQETVQKTEQTAENSKETEEKAREREEDSRTTEESVQEESIEIQYSSEYIRPVLGEQSNLVNQALQEYCTANHVPASRTDCLNCTIPLDDPAKTVFFLELQNEEKTLLQAIYDPASRSVLIEPSEYTKEEILNESWSTQEAPAVRDVEE